LNTDLKILALVPYPPDTAPSQRFRIEQWTPYLQGEGITVDLLPFVDERLMKFLYQPGREIAKAVAGAVAYGRRILHIAATPHYDAVLIHRAACLAGVAVLERALALFRRPVIFDFDDAIFTLNTTEANQRFGWLKFPGKTATLCRLSAHVVAGNSYLSHYARQFNPRVTIIPPSVDTDRYRPVRSAAAKGGEGPVVIGWTGSSTSQAYLEMFAPVLRELAARRDVEIRVHSDKKPALPGAPFMWRPWSAETEFQELAHFDIGIMPIPDDQWARGKCAMKALLYMAMGIPAICSAVGANCDVIRHGENGLLATTREEWLACLETLIDDVALRDRLGAAGRRTIEAQYSMRRCAAMFTNVVRDAVGRRRGDSAARKVASRDE